MGLHAYAASPTFNGAHQFRHLAATVTLRDGPPTESFHACAGINDNFRSLCFEVGARRRTVAVNYLMLINFVVQVRVSLPSTGRGSVAEVGCRPVEVSLVGYNGGSLGDDSGNRLLPSNEVKQFLSVSLMCPQLYCDTNKQSSVTHHP